MILGRGKSGQEKKVCMLYGMVGASRIKGEMKLYNNRMVLKEKDEEGKVRKGRK